MRLLFHPQLDTLEGRDVPAALSFQLPDGSLGSGSFSTPFNVDPAQTAQTFSLTDLTVIKGGVSYAVQPGATAQYSNGLLVAVSAVASGPDQISLNQGTVTVGSSTANVAYDGAGTEATFTLPDGSVGAISYQVPWGQVDPSQAQQAIPATAFNLNIAGKNFAFGSANYASMPTLLFANGNFQGINFALSASAQPAPGSSATSVNARESTNLALSSSTLPVFPYTSITMSGLNVTATQSGTGNLLFANAPLPPRKVILDFSNATTGQSYTIVLRFIDFNRKLIKDVEITVDKNWSAADLAYNIAQQLKGTPFVGIAMGTTLTITPGPDGGAWAGLNCYTYDTGGEKDPNLIGPALNLSQVIVVSGDLVQPQPQ